MTRAQEPVSSGSGAQSGRPIGAAYQGDAGIGAERIWRSSENVDARRKPSTAGSSVSIPFCCEKTFFESPIRTPAGSGRDADAAATTSGPRLGPYPTSSMPTVRVTAVPYQCRRVDVNERHGYHVEPMKFTKMHGAGNDYVYVDAFKEKIADPSALSIALSDRHTGVGSDGLILIAPSKKADFRMIMFNADGSEGSMCGNGIRCIGKYVYDHGLTKKKSITVETKSGTVSLDLRAKNGKVDLVTVDMGAARPVPKEFHVRADGVRPILEETVDGFSGFVASMGNPHFVIPVPSTETAPVTTK